MKLIAYTADSTIGMNRRTNFQIWYGLNSPTSLKTKSKSSPSVFALNSTSCSVWLSHRDNSCVAIVALNISQPSTNFPKSIETIVEQTRKKTKMPNKFVLLPNRSFTCDIKFELRLDSVTLVAYVPPPVALIESGFSMCQTCAPHVPILWHVYKWCISNSNQNPENVCTDRTGSGGATFKRTACAHIAQTYM